MTDEMPTTSGSMLGRTLPASAVAELAASFAGRLVQPGDADYDQHRAVFNGMIDRRPALIARCTGDADVVAAVNFARSQELLVAVRAGGHSVPGYGVCDGGIVIDVAPMKGVWVDEDRGVVRAQAGLTWGEFDRETQLVGLATTGGRRTSTGVAGQTLGSGSGWLERKFGLTCDNLVAAKLVTADGEIVRADETHNEDLLWGLRGGGGNFGVVTALQLRLHPVGPIVTGGMMVWPRARAGEVLRFWRDYVETASEDFGSAPAFLTAPPAPFVPEHLQGRPAFGLIVCCAGSPEDGEALVKPFREFSPDVDMVQPMPYTVVQSLIDEATPHGLHNYWKAENLPSLSDEAIDAIIDTAAGMTSPLSMVILEPKGRAISRVGDADSALGGRDAAHTLYCFSMWADPAESDTHVAWTRSLMQTLAPFTMPGVSLNFTSDQQEAKAKESFGSEEKNRRLTALKDRYDPTNFFRLNQNIRPSGAA
ncbi:MAG TPA: FAD-binding oxidoreductase [Acidimicrobiia bacterium]|nr:FAD-binding oxidoreductase [Acidimicrobiia bacterium]